MGRWSDKEELLRLAKDLPAVWESPTTDLALKRRITRILIHEIIANGSSMAFRDGKCKSSSRAKLLPTFQLAVFIRYSTMVWNDTHCVRRIKRPPPTPHANEFTAPRRNSEENQGR